MMHKANETYRLKRKSMRAAIVDTAAPYLEPCFAAGVVLALSLFLPLVSLAWSQNYPTSPMRIISPYPPGGGTDILSRAIGLRLTERFGQPVIVDNRGGANGTVGAGIAAKAQPDGHTMLVVAAGYAAGSSLYKHLPYDQSRDLTGVTLLASGPLVLVGHPSLPVRSVKELVALAKARPGELNVGSSGTGSLLHLSTELFGEMTVVASTTAQFTEFLASETAKYAPIIQIAGIKPE